MAYGRRKSTTRRRSTSTRRRGSTARRSSRRSTSRGGYRGGTLRIVLEQPMNPGSAQVVQEKRKTF